MTYQDFVHHCDIVMLEMCGSTPELDGTWDGRVASQLLHLAIGRDHDRPCLGVGYGFFPDTAFFVWAVNKLLGSDCWLSTLKGRLGLPASEVAGLADDGELVREGYVWERDHQHLFSGHPDTGVAVFFSRSTRDYYGQNHEDYVADYHAACDACLKSGVDFEVVVSVPEAGQWPVLVLSSAICLSEEEVDGLERYLQDGGTIIASGPTGLRDSRARPWSHPWLSNHGIEIAVSEPERVGGFPPYANVGAQASTCSGSLHGKPLDPTEWTSIDIGQGRLLWSPGRLSIHRKRLDLPGIVRANVPNRDVEIERAPAGWCVRRFRDGNRTLFLGLPAKVQIAVHESLRNQFIGQGIVSRLGYQEIPESSFWLQFAEPPCTINVFSPDLQCRRSTDTRTLQSGRANIDLTGISRFFVVEVNTA
jgi:hypothetical protein